MVQHQVNKNPVHAYNEDGVFTVSLTVSNSDGSDTKTKTDLITVNEVTIVSAVLKTKY